METISKIYQLKQIVKDIAVLQRTIKNHRKTVKFNGERETITLVTYITVYDAKTKKYIQKEFTFNVPVPSSFTVSVPP